MSSRRVGAGIVATVVLVVALASGEPQPAPPYPPPPPAPRAAPAPPPGYYPPPLVVVPPPPPPLSPAMRAIYAPFYVAGLVVRYGVYYLIVAPLEVFTRAVDYGPEGGVGREEEQR